MNRLIKPSSNNSPMQFYFQMKINQIFLSHFQTPISGLYYKITTSYLRRRTGRCGYLLMRSTETHIALFGGVNTTL